ncbi:polysaccharide deacetylase family protein [Sporosarcina sp. FSL K6-1508]|uniref:polysaccharide deacetylase family protein n=1 Tax=Sporosarcina sp. FSL K6-1508 TaxID=2921553 RepID=UPI0030FA4835
MGITRGKLYKCLILIIGLATISGCGRFASQKEYGEGKYESVQSFEDVARYTGKMRDVFSYVYTTRKELALTFNGMGDMETISELLDALDRHHEIKATFFLPGIRVAEEPKIAKMILARGHEIESNTLNQLDLSDMSYEQVYKEIQLSNEVIERETGVSPRYLRTKSGDYTNDIRLIAAQLGMDAVIHYSINPKDRDMKDAKSIGDYVKRYITRGAIISLNTDINPEVVASIEYISKAAEEINYTFVPLHELIANGSERKPLNEIAGFDAIKIDMNYHQKVPNLFHKATTDEKVIALTFDDWASDKTVTEILAILAEYEVKSTFFLIGKGVEKNPNLARAIFEEGHEVASHSYSHQVVMTMTPQEMQEDLVKSHEVLTEAIQQQPTLLFRPATGAIDEETAKIVAAVGYPAVGLYDLTSFDWNVSNQAEDIVQRVMSRKKPGSVIVLHILDETHTIEALPLLIEGLKREGYSFLKMSELMELETN